MFDLTPNGISWSPEFMQELYQIEEEFRSKIILEINDAVGKDWHISFVDFGDSETFLVDIYTDSTINIAKIMDIVKNKFHNQYKLQFWYQGTLQDLLSHKPMLQKSLGFN